MKSVVDVSVYDAAGVLVEHVSPAVARYAIKNNFAVQHAQGPFAIRLCVGLFRAPRPGETKPTEIIRLPERYQPKMSQHKYHNPAAALKKLSAILRTEQDIYVRAIQDPEQKGLIQVAISIPQDGYKIPPIQVGDPINLMRYASHEIWRANGDLRTYVQAGRLEVLTEEEADKVFQDKAARLRKSEEQVRREAERREAEYLTMKRPPKASTALQNEPKESIVLMKNGAEVLKEHGEVLPRVLALCNEAHPQQPVADRLGEADMRDALELLAPSMRTCDFEHLETAGVYPSVKAWAREQLEAQGAVDEE
jgi:hypothetical protein